jgi:hypothetical protein
MTVIIVGTSIAQQIVLQLQHMNMLANLSIPNNKEWKLLSCFRFSHSTPSIRPSFPFYHSVVGTKPEKIYWGLNKSATTT